MSPFWGGGPDVCPGEIGRLLWRIGLPLQTTRCARRHFAPDDADTAGRALSSRTRSNGSRRAPQKAAAGAEMLASPIAGLVLAGRAGTFARLDRASRERVLLRMKRIGARGPRSMPSRGSRSLRRTPPSMSRTQRRVGPARLPGNPRRSPRRRRAVSDCGARAGPITADAVVADPVPEAASPPRCSRRPDCACRAEAGPAFEPAAARQREAEAFARRTRRGVRRSADRSGVDGNRVTARRCRCGRANDDGGRKRGRRRTGVARTDGSFH